MTVAAIDNFLYDYLAVVMVLVAERQPGGTGCPVARVCGVGPAQRGCH